MRPRHVADVPTPALIVDVGALERNLTQMAGFFSAGSCRLRPHFKAHKTPEIARRQLAAGATTGLTCATVDELEIVAGLCGDLLLANEIVSTDKCRRAAAVARHVSVTVAIDSEVGLAALGAAAMEAGVTLGVLVDVNVGQNRCGVEPGAAALDLARRAAATGSIALRGVMGYEGHAQPIADRGERAAAAQQAMAQLVATANLIREDGLACDIVSAGGTGTYDISARVAGVTEIQAGSYALMDSDYGRLDVPFEQALFVIGTVVSHPAPGRIVADCGHKSCSKDHGHPTLAGVDGAVVISLNDEHATIAVPAGSRVTVGDRIRLRPSHVDPTVNLHDVLFAVDGDAVVDVWPVAARGYAATRG